MSDFDKIVNDVRIETYRQNSKWGQQDHADEIWLAILTEEVGEAAKAILDGRALEVWHEDARDELRAEVVQIAAVAIQWLMARERANG